MARIAGWLVALSVAGLALILGGRMLWERPYRGLSPVARRWGKLARVAGWAGLGAPPTRTPREVTDGWRDALWPRPIDGSPLAAAFSRERYGRPGYTESPEQEEELDSLYLQLRNRFLRRAFTRWRQRSAAP